ncbi:helicase-related protein [Neobacillus niacini]|uniref:helicase-related protein n=1 Tax=Neobacillus niacini TaxID=86668 RepID=UPI0037C9AED1
MFFIWAGVLSEWDVNEGRNSRQENSVAQTSTKRQGYAKQQISPTQEQPIFLISLKSGSTGLNLTGADTVILYDLWWNPAVEEQAAGRAHRIAQKNVVQVIRLIAQGTIEEKIYELQQNKKELIGALVDSQDQALSSLTEQEIREILSI